MPKVAKRSPIWLYFNDYSQNLAKCTQCEAIISTRGGSTSNLRRHLKYRHRKVIVDRTKKKISARKDSRNLKREDNFIEEEVIVVDEYQGNSLHTDVLFHDYAAVESVGETEELRDIPNTDNSEWEQQKVTKKPSIEKQRIQYKVLERHDPTEKLKTCSGHVNNIQIEAYKDIAINLGRIATAFERIADYICGSNNNDQSPKQPNNRDNNTRHNDTGLGAKVNDMILNVLGEEIVNASAIVPETILTENTNGSVQSSSLMKTLNLVPKTDNVNKNVNSSEER